MSQRGSSFSFQPKYTISRETKQEREARIRRVVSEFLESTRRCRTDVECLEAAFNYLVKNVSYVDGCIDNQNICSALLNHKSVCAGYSKSLQYLMQKMGKECLFISGITAKKGRHAWNIVKLGGKYYHTDVTFGDRSFSDGTMVGAGLPAELEAEYAYLCMSDEEALRERRITMKAGIRLPACTSHPPTTRDGLRISVVLRKCAISTAQSSSLTMLTALTSLSSPKTSTPSSLAQTFAVTLPIKCCLR